MRKTDARAGINLWEDATFFEGIGKLTLLSEN